MVLFAAAIGLTGSTAGGSAGPNAGPTGGAAPAGAPPEVLFQDSAKKTKKKPRKARAPKINLSRTFSLQFIYDDNILRMSDGTILDFRANYPPSKFVVETYDDLIVSPRLGFTFGRRLLGKKDTTLRLGYVGWFYSWNGEKTNMTYSFRFRQPTVGRDYLEASLSHNPISYIRHLSDRPPFEPRSTPLVYLPFKSVRNAAGLAYYRSVTPRVAVRGDLGRVIRYYNRPFMENDNWEWNGAGTLELGLTKSLKLTGRYMYSDVQSRNADTEGETDANTDDGDLNYERDLYELTLALRPRGWLWIANSVEVMAQYQAYFFTSQQHPLDDPYHVGRKDEIRTLETTVGTKSVWRSVTLEVGYRFSERDSSLPGRAGEDVGEEKDYTDNRAWIGLSTPF